MLDFFRNKQNVERFLAKYNFIDKKASLRQVLLDSSFNTVFRKPSAFKELIQLYQRQKEPVLKIKLISLTIQLLNIQDIRCKSILQQLQIFQFKDSQKQSIKESDLNEISKSILAHLSKFLAKLSNNRQILFTKDSQSLSDSINQSFIIINLINMLGPIAPYILKLGRYFYDFGFGVDLNISLCRFIAPLYNRVRHNIMDISKSQKQDAILIQIYKQIQNINQPLMIIYKNRYFHPFIKKYEQIDWLKPQQKVYEDLQCRTNRSRSVQQRRIRSILDVTQVEVSSFKDRSFSFF